ncbi:MAG: EamA family transporter [Pseudonocardia sp.]|nr:EamA family transporter [Pseudonocardia sp.]
MSPATKFFPLSLGIGLVSASLFGLSGPLAKAMMDNGWSAGAAVIARIGGAAIIMATLYVGPMRHRFHIPRQRRMFVVIYGVIAVAGVQLCYFNAVRHMSVGVALLVEYLAPVAVVGWVWVSTRSRPALTTLVGAMIAIAGLVLVIDISDAAHFSTEGLAWALLAATCLACYFLISENTDSEVPPLTLTAGGIIVGAITVTTCGLLGIMPITITTNDLNIAGYRVNILVPLTILILLSTVVAYLSGIIALSRLGATFGSFVALSEVLFAVLASWLLLAEVPTNRQLLGGLCILLGVTLVRLQPPRKVTDNSSLIVRQCRHDRIEKHHRDRPSQGGREKPDTVGVPGHQL